ncbi:hypothetical protein SO802_007002 [Lithocarpus litseifolius]|uniref:Desiccation-related protein PCC13-62 n=1 Tax=Lithocarpus litseifolius TaxID=425828 RepID=A0AAW2DP52_9ROSI
MRSGKSSLEAVMTSWLPLFPSVFVSSNGRIGHGLDKVAPNLTKGGPTPIGAKQANLDHFTQDIIKQFAFQEVGHLRAIQKKVKGFPRPLLDLSKESFAKVVDTAFGGKLTPPFDPYANGINFLLASYLIPYVGLTGYVGTIPKLKAPASRRLVAGLLGVESGQDAVIRAYLYEHAHEKVKPYGLTVAEFTHSFSELRDKLGHAGYKDEGLVVPLSKGAEGEVTGNVLAGDEDSVAFDRTAKEILRIVYATVVVVLRGKANLSALEVGDVDKAGGARGRVSGLEHGGGQGSAVGDLVELFGSKVVEEHVEGEDVFDGVDGRVGGEEVGHGSIVDGADGYGGATVDLAGEVREGEVVVEGREVWELS